jgi:L-threonylcarbamoyladenylate synthase
LSGLPIGAPSANLFGHVSPTEPIHVFNDFYDQEIAIIDGERCEYGLESTVVKLTENKLSILRQGSFIFEKLK